jgi:hypothetical protein
VLHTTETTMCKLLSTTALSGWATLRWLTTASFLGLRRITCPAMSPCGGQVDAKLRFCLIQWRTRST